MNETELENLKYLIERTLDLHILSEEGKEDTEEADRIRDQMEHPWYALTKESQNWLSRFSERLYALAEKKGKELS